MISKSPDQISAYKDVYFLVWGTLKEIKPQQFRLVQVAIR